MPYADFCPAVRRPFDHLSRRGDAEQISWGKLNRLPCTVAESTLRVLDGYGLRGKLPARPALAPCIRFLSMFVPCFLQTPPRGGSPCIITRPYLHQVGQRTFTSKLLSMPSTQRSRFAADANCRAVRFRYRSNVYRDQSGVTSEDNVFFKNKGYAPEPWKSE